ncbi:MAG: SpoIVB peptidase [Clostridia bacterium]|nr:SpoIVB peptidase [Candidatus Pelethousia sp.]NCB30630.1 SpoIVB peptidase [Clostridia bacterium]
MRKHGAGVFIRCLGLIICLLLISFNYGPQMQIIRSLPKDAYIDSESETLLSSIRAPFGLRYDEEEQAVMQNMGESLETAEKGQYSVTVDLFGLIPVKTVSFHPRDQIWVMPGGQSVGVTLYTKGALVVGLGNFFNAAGEQVCPAQAAGIRVGDVILAIEGSDVKNAEHLITLCNETEGDIGLTVSRNGQTLNMNLQPVADAADGINKMGMWVRDSTAGIGTLSFYSMATLRYGALGHPITDVDTGSLLSVKEGTIIHSSVVGVAQGASGLPGEIRGAFSTVSRHLGTLDANCNLGIYGQLYEPMENPLYPKGVLLAYPEEAHTGPAQLLTTVDSDGVQAYDCEIIKTYQQSSAEGKGMVIQITDPDLIEKTGGIVQGMSGSPILQDGKLVGAVTHVFVNDPLRGYCIYALWMYELC